MDVYYSIKQKQIQQLHQNKKTRYVSNNDKRIRRWMLQVNENQIFEDDEEIARKIENDSQGKCGWIKRCFYDCKRDTVEDYDITNVNLGVYFD